MINTIFGEEEGKLESLFPFQRQKYQYISVKTSVFCYFGSVSVFLFDKLLPWLKFLVISFQLIRMIRI